MPYHRATIMSIVIQYASDIHLETRREFKDILTPEPGVPYLALCGDIGRLSVKKLLIAFLKYTSDNWEHVWYVPGNHELYIRRSDKCTSAHEVLAELRIICEQFPNVHFLHRDVYDVPNTNVRVIGTTMWSHVPENKMAEVSLVMNDYNFIYANQHKSKLTADIANNWHAIDCLWLQDAITEAAIDHKIALVLTHHLPSFAMIPDAYKCHAMNCFFASHQDSLVTMPGIGGWLCGHSHGVKLVTFSNGCVCALNACGYNGEQVTNYKKNATLHISLGF
jgi:hypothetical protein